MKKMLLLTMAAVLFCSCGGKTLEFKPPLSLTLAVVEPETNPLSYGLKEFSHLAAERSHDTLKIEVVYSRKLGEDRLILEKVKNGDLSIACVSALALGDRDESFNALSLPFIFKDEAHYARVLEGDIGLNLLKSLEKEGVEGLGYFDAGALQFFSSKMDLKTPADFKKLRTRLPQIRALRQYVEKLGGFVSPMPADQVFNALKRGFIDAAANTLDVYAEGSFDQAARHFTVIGHSRVPGVLVMSQAALLKMPAGAVDFLREAARDSSRAGRGKLAVFESDMIQKLRGKGVIVSMIDDPKTFLVPASSVYQEQSDAVKTVIAKIQALR